MIIIIMNHVYIHHDVDGRKKMMKTEPNSLESGFWNNKGPCSTHKLPVKADGWNYSSLYMGSCSSLSDRCGPYIMASGDYGI